MSHWATILTPAQIDAHFTRFPEHRAFDEQARRVWEGRTVDQLKAERADAWRCNDGESFMLARSFLAIRLGTQEV